MKFKIIDGRILPAVLILIIVSMVIYCFFGLYSIHVKRARLDELKSRVAELSAGNERLRAALGKED